MQKHALAFGGLSLPGIPLNLTLAILRVFAGASIALGHGIRKLPPAEGFIAGVENMGFPLPIAFAWMAALSEFVGGILVALGFLTRPAAFFVTCTMLTAAFVHHGADPFAKRELALLFAAVFLFFAVNGSGRVSIDALIEPRFAKKKAESAGNPQG